MNEEFCNICGQMIFGGVCKDCYLKGKDEVNCYYEEKYLS